MKLQTTNKSYEENSEGAEGNESDDTEEITQEQLQTVIKN
jgi:hypothetical protein